MNKAAVFLLVLVGVGLFLWMRREEIVLDSGAVTGAAAIIPSVQEGQFIIREKIKPGGYIGWHETERNKLTTSPVQTRQASHYYFVCTERNSGVKKIFLVPESSFNTQRLGNVLTAHDMNGFQEVSDIKEPPLPPSFQFRRREPK